MSWQPHTDQWYISQLRKEQNKLRDIVYKTNLKNTTGIDLGGLGGVSGASTTGAIGISRFQPFEAVITNIDQTGATTSDYDRIHATTVMIICKPAGSGNNPSATNPQIKWVDHTSGDGQLLMLTPQEGTTLTLEAGGNINIGSNTTVSDDEIMYLLWLNEHPTDNSTTGSYNLLKLTTGGTSGANTSLSNLSGTAINTDLAPPTSGTGLLDLGKSNKQWKDLWIDGVAYIDGLGQDLEMNSLSLLETGRIYFNTMSASTTNGTIWFDGTHIKCRTNSAEKILSNIGSGGSTSFVGFTADDDLAMGTYNINNLDQLIFGTGGSTTSPSWDNADHGLEVDSSGNLEYNVPSGEVHDFRINGDRAVSIASSYIFIDTGVTQIMQNDCYIRANGNTDYIAFHCSNGSNAGSKGAVEIPYDESTTYPSSQSTLDGLFGTDQGSIGVYEDTNATVNYRVKFYYRGDDGWYQISGAKV